MNGPSNQISQGMQNGHISHAIPSHRHPLHRLPVELVLEIIDCLNAEQFIRFAFAHYPFLQCYGLVPAMSTQRLSALVKRSRLLPTFLQLVRLPTETLLEIMRHLNPIDTMRFVLANYQHLAMRGIAPRLTRTTMWSLEQACLPDKMGGDEG